MKKIFIPLVILSLFLSGCTNLFDEPNSSNNKSTETSEKLITVCGNINFSGAVPKEIVEAANFGKNDHASRAAHPSIPVESIFFVTATCPGKDSVNGVYSHAEGKHLFSIGLTAGTWKIKAGLKDENENELLVDSITKELTEDDTIVNLNFLLKPVHTQNGKGNANLSFKNAKPLPKVTVKYLIPDLSQSSAWPVAENERTLDIESNSTSNLEVEDIPAGIYDITFNFYKDGQFIYSVTQAITIFENMTTDRWVSGASEDSASDISITTNGSTNSLEINDFVIQNFARTTFYVDGTNGSDTAGTGGPYSPLKNVATAVKIISSMDSGSNYNIFVANEHREEITSTLNIDRNICLRAYNNFPGDDSGTFTLERNFSDLEETVKVESGITFEVHNAIIQGNNQNINIATSSGISTAGNLKLYDCTIQKFSSTNGGGMTVSSGTVLLSNTKITENVGRFNGGGIQISGGTVIFESGEISNNTTGESKYYGGPGGIGGGVKISSGSFTMKGGTIKQNTCKSNGTGGAGIGIENGTFNFYGGTIENNTGGLGKGVYYYDGTFNISGSASASDDNDIYIKADKFITIEENLTPKDSGGNAKEYAAVITPASYPSGSDSVKVLDGTTALINANYKKFSVTDPDDVYGITKDGNIKNLAVIELSYSDTKKTFKSLNAAFAYCKDLTYNATISITDNIDIEEPLTLTLDNQIKVLLLNSTTSDLTIKRQCTGDLITVDAKTGTFEINAISVTKNLYIDGNTTTYSDSQGSLIKVVSGTVNSVKNVYLQNNYNINGNGGGVYICSGATMNVASASSPYNNMRYLKAKNGACFYNDEGTIESSGIFYPANVTATEKGNILYNNGTCNINKMSRSSPIINDFYLLKDATLIPYSASNDMYVEIGNSSTKLVVSENSSYVPMIHLIPYDINDTDNIIVASGSASELPDSIITKFLIESLTDYVYGTSIKILSKQGKLVDDIAFYFDESTNTISLSGNLSTGSNTVLKNLINNATGQVTVDLRNSSTMYSLSKCKMAKVILPTDLTTLPQSAFNGCSSLSIVDFSNCKKTLTKIESDAFDHCSNIETLDLSELENLARIETYCIAYMTNLVTIKFPASLNYLGTQNLMNCDKIKNIYINAITPPTWDHCSSDTHQTTVTRNDCTWTSCEMDKCDEYVRFYVPAASVDAYKTHTSWERYSGIIESQ